MKFSDIDIRQPVMHCNFINFFKDVTAIPTRK